MRLKFRHRLTLIAALVCASIFGISQQVFAQQSTPWADTVIKNLPPLPTPTGTLTKAELDSLTQRGETLFNARFTTPDGIGRPMASGAIIPTKLRRASQKQFDRVSGPDANGCASCHNVPFAGGAGDFTANVFVSEGFSGQGADSTDPQFSNERNTNHIFGAGLIELLAREMSRDLLAIRRQTLQLARSSGTPQTGKLITKGVDFGTLTAQPDGIVDLSGLTGIDDDLTIRPFTQKGVMTSLRQFTLNALNDHHGIQSVERFGARWTGEDDFDEDGIADEIGATDISALVAWQATLAPPTILTPTDPNWITAAAKGSEIFTTLSCTSCHRRTLPLDSLTFADPGPMDAAGTLRTGEGIGQATYDLALTDWAKSLAKNDKGQYLVPLFGDLKRYNMSDAEVDTLGNELLAQRFVERAIFITGELWGIASTAPYGHRGDQTTLDEIIRAHGGQSRASRDAYIALTPDDRSALTAYLKTLVITP